MNQSGCQSIRLLAAMLTMGWPSAPSRAQESSKGAKAPVEAQGIASRGVEQQLLQALKSQPATAPFTFTVTKQGGRLALGGRVASLAVHDAAIQTAIALGVPVRDDLVIDTGLAGLLVPTFPANRFVARSVLPPPILGGIDPPFLGIDPPLVSFPPWFGLHGSINGSSARPAPSEASGLPLGAVELTVDSLGVAYLRGTVPTINDRDALSRKVAAVPGISRVVNMLAVASDIVDPTVPIEEAQEPPPPPTPVPPAPQADAPREAQTPRAIEPVDPLSVRVAEALRRRPAIKDITFQITNRRGLVRLEGRVPTLYEALIAFRAAQQTPGVHEVDDRLSFEFPQDGEPSPLATKGRPEDVEPFVLSHVRRQLGDLAHVDQVRLNGDSLEIVGSLARAEDSTRVEATLRSIPLLRGLKLVPTFFPN